VPTYDRLIDRPYDRRQNYKDSTYVHFFRGFLGPTTNAIDDDDLYASERATYEKEGF